MNYETVIGMEVHVELNTKSKMFCRCSADYFGKEPNTHVCPVCLGLPGALPYPNKKALEYCMMIGLALGCKINEKSLFERKNYFYPDLPKGYQISQYRWPLCIGGRLQVTGNSIRINRAHMEEDTAKLTHAGNESLIDFNRSGVPLVEIVTEPDFRNVEEVRDYAKALQQLFRYLGVSNADMERGDMRLEANVSVRKLASHIGSGNTDTELPNYRVELKNINSFRFMKAAIEYEIKRQIAAIEKGEKLFQETRGWNEDKKSTYLQRSKEEAHDYRYFPEPDIPELSLQLSAVSLQQKIPELPWDKNKRFQKEYGLTKQQAEILTETRELADFYEKVVKIKETSAIQVANYLINKKINIKNILPAQIIAQIMQNKVGQVTDEKELEKLAKEAISENPKAVEDYKKGKETAVQALIGAVMKKSLGKADATKAREILERLLKD